MRYGHNGSTTNTNETFQWKRKRNADGKYVNVNVLLRNQHYF